MTSEPRSERGGAEAKQKQARDEFHKHLDVCSQCARQPFNLCPIGARLITEAVR